MKVSVRTAGAADIPEMCSLLSELFSIEADFSPDRGKQERGLALLLNEAAGSSTVLVAEHGNRIIGMCSVQILISTAEGGPVGFIEDLVVKKDHRGMGTGTRLLSEITAWCLTRNIPRIQLLRDIDNSGARRFYLSAGWADTKLVCMRKLL